MLTCRMDAKKDYEHLGLGTPPNLFRQNSLGRSASANSRHTDDESPLRRRAVKVPKILMLLKANEFYSVNVGNRYSSCKVANVGVPQG